MSNRVDDIDMETAVQIHQLSKQISDMIPGPSLDKFKLDYKLHRGATSTTQLTWTSINGDYPGGETERERRLSVFSDLPSEPVAFEKSSEDHFSSERINLEQYDRLSRTKTDEAIEILENVERDIEYLSGEEVFGALHEALHLLKEQQ